MQLLHALFFIVQLVGGAVAIIEILRSLLTPEDPRFAGDKLIYRS
jgi:hypothetical protein